MTFLPMPHNDRCQRCGHTRLDHSRFIGRCQHCGKKCNAFVDVDLEKLKSLAKSGLRRKQRRKARKAAMKNEQKPEVSFSEVKAEFKAGDLEFKSWREEYNLETVAEFLKEHKVENWTVDCIAGDGDLLLKSAPGPLACYSLGQLKAIQDLFGAHEALVEIDGPDEKGFHILLTLSWN